MQKPSGPIRILDICGRNGKIIPAIIGRFKGKQIEYTNIDLQEMGSNRRKFPWITKIDYKQVQIDFSNPKKMASQLKNALSDGMFDEIHLHMPIESAEYKGKELENLKNLLAHLKDGGHLYHIYRQDEFDQQSPIVSWTRKRFKTQDQNKEIQGSLARFAKKAGVKLIRYGFKVNPELKDLDPGNWYSAAPGLGRQERQIKSLKTLAGKYTDYPSLATHFVIFQKTKPSK